ncbi:MAG: response regulator transcription factor [Acidobacteria bacterium]|nr:response regulator transcription factor [Acidobacteriota bacterium]
MKLLIVEDNPAIRQMMRRLVEDLAQEIYECDDGAEALDAYREVQPDWVLMDLQMPRLNGLAATQQLLGYDPAAHVLIVTNYDDAALRNAASEVGACGYILKEDLFEVRAQLQKTQTPPPATTEVQ